MQKTKITGLSTEKVVAVVTVSAEDMAKVMMLKR